MAQFVLPGVHLVCGMVGQNVNPDHCPPQTRVGVGGWLRPSEGPKYLPPGSPNHRLAAMCRHADGSALLYCRKACAFGQG